MNTKLTKELFEQDKTLREQGLSFAKFPRQYILIGTLLASDLKQILVN